VSMTAGEFAEVLHAGWTAVPNRHASLMTSQEIIVMVLQAMERKAREFQRVDDRAAKEEIRVVDLSSGPRTGAEITAEILERQRLTGGTAL